MKLFKLTFLIMPALLGACSLLDAPMDFTQTEVTDNMQIGLQDLGSDLFYYNYNERVSLTERKDLVLLRFSDNLAKEQFQSELINGISDVTVSQTTGNNFLNDTEFNFLILESSNKQFSDDRVKELRSDSNILHASYMAEYQGNLLAPTTDFSVKLKNSTSLSDLEELAAKLNCAVFQRDKFPDDVYLFVFRKNPSMVLFYCLISFSRQDYSSFLLLNSYFLKHCVPMIRFMVFNGD